MDHLIFSRTFSDSLKKERINRASSSRFDTRAEKFPRRDRIFFYSNSRRESSIAEFVKNFQPSIPIFQRNCVGKKNYITARKRVYFPSLKISARGLPPAFPSPGRRREWTERGRGGGLIKICIYFNSSQSVEMGEWITRFAYSRRSAYISASYRKIFN